MRESRRRSRSVQSSRPPDTAAGTRGSHARLLTTPRGLGPGRLALLGVTAVGLLGYLAFDFVEPRYGLP